MFERLRYALQGLKPAPFQVQADFLRTGNSPSSNHEISIDPETGKPVNYRRHLILQTSKYFVLMLIFFVLHNVFLFNPPLPHPFDQNPLRGWFYVFESWGWNRRGCSWNSISNHIRIVPVHLVEKSLKCRDLLPPFRNRKKYEYKR